MSAADELRALTAAATAGPWYTTPAGSLMSTPTKAPVAVTLYGGEANRALIVWLVNHADALADLIDAAEALEDEPWSNCAEDDNACLDHFDELWPCRGVRFRNALAALDADR